MLRKKKAVVSEAIIWAENEAMPPHAVAGSNLPPSPIPTIKIHERMSLMSNSGVRYITTVESFKSA